jgi:moderate conductance mechanosensitive channel
MRLAFLDVITNPSLHDQFTDWMSQLFTWALTSGIKVIFIVLFAWLLKVLSKRFVQRIVRAAVSSDKLALEEGDVKRMNTLVRIFSWTINTIIVVIAAMMVLQEFGVKIAPILASAGIVGVAIGFGGQYLVKDAITGFFIIFENQYRIGDVINVNDVGGVVEDISLRITTLRDMNGTVHYVPHGEVKIVSNLSKHFAKVNLNVGVSYDSDLEKVKEVVNRIGNELATDPAWKTMLNTPPQFLRVDSLDDSCITIKVVAETKPLKQWDVTGELRKRIKEGFEKEGIDIPFPQRVIHYIGDKDKNSEA